MKFGFLPLISLCLNTCLVHGILYFAQISLVFHLSRDAILCLFTLLSSFSIVLSFSFIIIHISTINYSLFDIIMMSLFNSFSLLCIFFLPIISHFCPSSLLLNPTNIYLILPYILYISLYTELIALYHFLYLYFMFYISLFYSLYIYFSMSLYNSNSSIYHICFSTLTLFLSLSLFYISLILFHSLLLFFINTPSVLSLTYIK